MSLLDSKNVLAGIKAPTSLSTIGKSYDVAAGANNNAAHNATIVSTIAQQQNKTLASTSRADRWDSAELVESVIEEAEQARRQRQIDKALRSRNRTTLVERERLRNKERSDARLANASAETAATENASGGGENANDSKSSPTAAGGGGKNNNSATAPNNNIAGKDVNRSVNSFAQVAADPMKKLLQLNLNGLNESNAATAAAAGNASTSTPMMMNNNNGVGGSENTAVGRRGVTILSSPRQNPLLAAKVQSELRSNKMDTFLQSTAKAMGPQLDDLVTRNLSHGTTRRLRREAILARQQRRILRGTTGIGGGGGGGNHSDGGDDGEDYDSAEEELRQQHIRDGGGVSMIGVRGALNRQREAVYSGVGGGVGAANNNASTSSPTGVAVPPPMTAFTRPDSQNMNRNNTNATPTTNPNEMSDHNNNNNHSLLSTFRSHSPPATSTLKIPLDLKSCITEAQEAHRSAHHAQNHRPTSPIAGGDQQQFASGAGVRSHSPTNNPNNSSFNAGATAGNSNAPPVVLPPNATFLQLAAKASIKDAIVAAEAQDRRLKTSTVISTSTDKYGNIIKLDGIMLVDNSTAAVTAEGIATATKMAKVGATDASGGATKKGFFGRSASPLQLLQIPDGTPIEKTTTYKPGAALSTLVENKNKLSRSQFIEARRETSSFNAPPRPALLMPTSAPLHASYHIRYGTVERQCPSSSFAAMDHHKFNQSEKNKEATRRRQREAEDASFASTTQQQQQQIGNVSAITTTDPSSAAGSNSRRANSPTNNNSNNDPNSTFFSLTQAKLGETNRTTNTDGGYESNSSDGSGGSGGGLNSTNRKFRKKKNHELIPTANRPEARQEAHFRMNNTTVPDQSILSGPTDQKDYRMHDVRDTSSSFKTGRRAFPMANLQDLYYYPLAEPGLKNYGGGKIVGNARERDWTPFGAPCGAPTTYNLDLIDERHRQEQRSRQTPAFGKIVGRAEQKHPFVQSNVPCVDTSQFNYKDQHGAVEKRTSCYVSMRKQTSRPPTKLASKTEAPHMNLNSIVSVPKKGFVDLGRMTNYETRDPDYFAIKRANDTTTPLFVNPDSVLYTHPAFSFNKGSVRFGDGPSSDKNSNTRSREQIKAEYEQRQHQRSHSSMSLPRRTGGDFISFNDGATIPRRPHSTEPTDNGYANDSPIRRRAPAAAFPLTDRETRPILRVPAPGDYTKGVSAQVFPAKDANYDTDKFSPTHVPAANFAPLVSRDQREKSLQQRFASTDAVYDVPRSDKIKMVMPFDKTTGR